jgi:hypothetical protein
MKLILWSLSGLEFSGFMLLHQLSFYNIPMHAQF